METVSVGGRLEELSGLFDGKENAATVIYHVSVSQWCEANGIALMGHSKTDRNLRFILKKKECFTHFVIIGALQLKIMLLNNIH